MANNFVSSKDKRDPFRVRLNWDLYWWKDLKKRKYKVYFRETIKEHIQHNRHKRNEWVIQKAKPRHRNIRRAREWRWRIDPRDL